MKRNREIVLFCEDHAHEKILQSLVHRSMDEAGMVVNIQIRSARGGHGRMLTELKTFVRDLEHERSSPPDLFIVGRDANCKGVLQREKELMERVKPYQDRCVFAVPDPHIERWLLVDPKAFKEVLGTGCQLPRQKCEKNRYKELLMDAVRDAGYAPILGGLEHAEDIVNKMDLVALEATDSVTGLGRFLGEIRSQVVRWTHQDAESDS